MSDEHLPKLRLKPKLAADSQEADSHTTPATPASSQSIAPVPAPASTSTTPPTAAANVPEPLVPPATADAPKFVRLKPRLTANPSTETTPAQAAEPVVQPPLTPDAVPDEPAPAPQAAKPVAKFSLRPKALGQSPSAAAKPAMPPPTPTGPKIEPMVMPTPPGLAVLPPDSAQEGEPAELTAMREASKSPFPQAVPPAKFPAPAGKLSSEKKGGGGAKKLGVLLALLVVLGGGGYYVYTNFLVEPPAPEPIRPKLAANPTTPQGQAVAKAKALTDAANAKAAEAVNEIMPETQPAPAVTTSSVPEKTDAAGATAGGSAPTTFVAPAKAPTPSLPFRAWVDALRISGVRAGASPKVFIGGTAYSPGDLVNPQLGIVFEKYDPDTRLLTFREKSGAVIDKRN